jgi:hypothetical protein
MSQQGYLDFGTSEAQEDKTGGRARDYLAGSSARQAFSSDSRAVKVAETSSCSAQSWSVGIVSKFNFFMTSRSIFS